MQVTIRIQRTGTGLTAYGAKQVPFAMANAMNRTLEEGQAAVREGIHARFTIRTPFIDRLVKIRPEDRATKERLVARLRIDGPEGDAGKAAILSRHEEGGVHTTGIGGYSIDPSYRVQGMFFLPTDALRSSPSDVIRRADYPANLRLSPRQDVSGGTLGAKVHRTARGALQLKGKRRTFVLFGANGGPPIGIFQREGPASHAGRHDSNIKELWRFKPSITLKPRLHFIPTVTDVVRTRYQINLRGMLAYAFKTAK